MSQRSLLGAGIEQLGLSVPGARHGDFCALLLDYLAELAKWNQVYNLTRIPEADWIPLHLLDSLSIGPFVTADRIADVGAGGGLPGIPLSLLYPDKQFTLIDSNGKKTRFLEHVRIRLKLHNVSIVQSRTEDFVGQFDHVTCRAFASLAEINALTAHLLNENGTVLAMKGEVTPEELNAAMDPLGIEQVIPLAVPGIDVPRNLVILRASP